MPDGRALVDGEVAAAAVRPDVGLDAPEVCLMATWTELFGAAMADNGRDADRVVLPDELRELLLDLPHHPGVSRLRAVTLHLETGVEFTLDLPVGLSMASGASGPIAPGAGVQRDTVQPWRVTPVLGDAGLSDEAAAALDRLHKAPREWDLPKVETAPADTMDRLIILPGDA